MNLLVELVVVDLLEPVRVIGDVVLVEVVLQSVLDGFLSQNGAVHLVSGQTVQSLGNGFVGQFHGFVDAVHGKGGGYRLNRRPEDYTVGSILKLTEGGLTAVSCTSQGASACSRAECCNALPMWERLDKMINDFFEGITIADLLKDSQSQ